MPSESTSTLTRLCLGHFVLTWLCHSCCFKTFTSRHTTNSSKMTSHSTPTKSPPFILCPAFFTKNPHTVCIKVYGWRWINLSPLCVALTRRSSSFMADWICVIKETTSKTICLSHPSVIAQRSPSAAHQSKTTAMLPLCCETLELWVR